MRVSWGFVGVAIVCGSALAQTPATDKDFCERAQREMTGATVPLTNIVYESYDAFKESKTKVDPLEIGQYVFADANRKPVRVSCKLKTSDHIQSRYGTEAARGDSKVCGDINRAAVDAVYAAIPEAERAGLRVARADIVIEPDDVVPTGSAWIEDFDAVWRGPDGKVHIKSKTLYVTWSDWKYFWLPERFRGVRYCHFLAPEYVQRLATGEAPVPPPSVKN